MDGVQLPQGWNHFEETVFPITDSKPPSFLMILKKITYSNKKCMAISLRELQSHMSSKDAASSTEGITRSIINYLC